MVPVTEVMDRLLAACPGFAESWREHLECWGSQERGHFNDAVAFARWVVETHERGGLSEVAAAFDAIEELLAQGDAKTREIATIGLLEDIQTIASHKPLGYAVFVPYLGPLSAEAWVAIEKTWEGKASLMDVVRSEVKRKQ